MVQLLHEALDALPLGAKLNLLLGMVNDLSHGQDPTVAALREHADAIGARLLLVGGVAVIKHGYGRTTSDRDVLVSDRDAPKMADRLMDDPDWERLEIRQWAFLYRPTGIAVDFLVSGDLMQLGRPYLFPRPESVEAVEGVEGVPVIGLHDLLYFKLMAGRMQDLADTMQLCKLHLNEVSADRVLAPIQPEDDDLRKKFLDLLAQAPVELANEQRLGQGIGYKRKPNG
jgi:hypothetical protein